MAINDITDAAMMARLLRHDSRVWSVATRGRGPRRGDRRAAVQRTPAWPGPCCSAGLLRVDARSCCGSGRRQDIPAAFNITGQTSPVTPSAKHDDPCQKGDLGQPADPEANRGRQAARCHEGLQQA